MKNFTHIKIKLSNLILGLVFIINSFLINAQCPVTAFSSPTTIYCGDTATLGALASGCQPLNNNFNGGVIGSWAASPGGVVTNGTGFYACAGPPPEGAFYLWMGGTVGAPRGITTNDYDLTQCGAISGTLCFEMKYATQGGADPCEGIDLPAEGISVQYSTNGGAAWTTLQYYDPNGGYDATLTSWNRYCLVLPAAAMTTSTRFRWYQSQSSGAGFDTWGLDNMVLTLNGPGYTFDWAHDAQGPTASAFTPDVSPTTTTTYTVTYTNGTPAQTCTASVTVNVIAPTVTATASPTSICNGGSSQLTASSSLTTIPVTSCGVNATGACPPNSVADEKKIGSGALVYGYNDGSYPTFGNFGSAYATTHILYRASELLAAGMVAGQINSLAFDVNIMRNSAGSMVYPEIKIDMGCTSATTMVNYTNPAITFSNVFTPKAYTMNVGTKYFFFDKSYNWDGVQNIVIRICWRVATGGSAGAMTRYAFTSDNAPGYNCVFSGNSNFEAGQCAISSFTSLQNRRPNTTFGFCKPRSIPLVYTWTPTTGLSNPNIYNPVATPGSTTTYTVSVQETGAPAACAATAPVTVTITTVGSLTAVNGSRCGTGTVALSVGGACAGGTINWYNVASGGVSIATGVNFTTPSISTTTTYYASCKIGACEGGRIPVVATVNSITAIVTTIVNATCGASNGSVTFGAVTGGTPGYTYNFNNLGFSATTNYTGLAAGTYPLVVKDATGCTFTTSVIITTMAPPTNIATTLVQPSCGNATGSVTLGAVTGGTPAYTYNFNNLGFSATTSYTLLAAGTYPIVVKDANGCTYTTSVTLTNVPGPTNIVKTVVNASCGNATGSITLGAVTGGTPAYTYSFNGSAYTATTSYTALLPGTYTIDVKDSNGCIYTTSATVLDVPGPTAVAYTTVNSSCSTANGSVTITGVTGGTAAYTYEFAGSGSYTGTLTYSGLSAGSYTLNVKDANGCIYTTSVNIVDNLGPTNIATTVVNATCGLANGSITIGAITGGTGPYTYSFNGGGYTTTITYAGLTAGAYTIGVKDANGCTYTTTVTVIDNPGPTAIATTITNSTCGVANGSVTLGAVTGGSPAYTYNFNGMGFSGVTSYNSLAAGGYPLIVKDANGCTFTTSITIIDNPGPTAVTTFPINSNCGLANGSVTIGTVTGGTPGYTYNFNGMGFSATTNYTGLATGSYSLIVKDANGCLYNTTVTIIDNPGPTAIATNTTNSSCGAADGSVTITGVTGGTPAYTYNFNGLGFSGTTTYSGLLAGSYPLIVKDANGCTFTITITIINNPGPTAITATTVNSSCGAADGSITITGVTGGTPAYLYDFNGSGFTATTTYGGLIAGSYSVTVKDANGCTFTTSFTVGNNLGPTAVVLTPVNSNCGAADGSFTIGAVTGGTPAYTYSFNGGGFSVVTSYTGLLSGSYPVVVKDANGCLYNASVTITDNPGPTAIATTIVDASCGSANGSVTITGVTGGTAGYTYDFNGMGFSGTTSYTGLVAGSYSIIVKDVNGCTFMTSVSVIDAPGATAIASTVVDASCGTPNGSVTLGAVTGGTPAYTYDFNGLGYSSTTTYSGLTAGSYVLNVKDANGCIYTTVISISNLGGPTAIATTQVNTVCGGSNGSITLGSVTGGLAPYSFDFNGTGYSGVTSYSGLAAGTYSIDVKDANGCIYSTSVVITDAPGPTAIAITIVNETCGGISGSVTLGTVTGGTPVYTYEFNNTGYGSVTSFTGLAAGSYPINVKDANGCIYTTSVTITNLPGPTAIAMVVVDETCGNNNGSVTLGAVTGGTGPYTYDFNNMGYPGSTTYTGLSAGVYPLEVQDANGCKYLTSVTILDNPGPTAIATTVVDEACGAADGSVTITSVTGGVAPYTYNFNGAGFSATTAYTGLIAGIYPIIVKDANGCTFSMNVTINNSGGPTALATTVVNENCGATDGSVTLGAVTGGSAPYQYNFNGMGYSGVTSYSGLAAGIYPIIVKDANGCIYNLSVTITNSGGPTALSTTQVNETCGSGNGSVSIGAVTGGTAPYTYEFNGGGYLPTTVYSGLSAGTYPINVKDANGCILTINVTITDAPGPTALATTVVNESCSTGNGSIIIGATTGGTAPYIYDFNGSGSFNSTTSYTGLVAGTYSIEVKDANGCTFSITVPITNTTGPTAIAVTTVNAACGISDGSVTLGTVTGGTAPYQYNFNSAGFSSVTTYSGLAAGSYSLIVKDANGCTYTTSVSISNAGGPTAIATTLVNETCTSGNGSVTLGAVTGGTPPYSYNYDNNGYTTTTIYNGQVAGVHSIDIKDASGCIYSTTVTITDAPGPTAITTTIVDSTCGNPNGSVTINSVTNGTAPYQYDFNGMGYSASTSYTGLAAGTYILNVRDTNNCIYSTSVTLTTTVAPTVTISYTGTPFCSADTSVQPVTITGTGVYTGGVYSAPIGLTLDTATGGITPSTSTPGTYTVTYTIAPTGGCPTITATTSVTINPELAPTITCGPPTTTSVQFNWGAVTGATGYDVSYTVTGNPAVNAGSVGNVTTYDVTGLTPGSVVTITVTPTNPSGGCFKSASFACTASSCTPATANISYATPFCSNNATPQSVTLTGTGTYTGGGYTGTAGLAINATTGAITPGSSTAGSHTITYLLTGTGGCPDVTATTTIMITPLPTAAISYASTSYCTSNTFPQGVSLTGTGAYTGGTYSAAPAGLSINASTGAVTPGSSAAGNYTITYTTPASGGCAAVTTTTMVTITQLPTATISYATPFCISTGTPQSVTITGTAAYTGGTYSAPGGLTIDVNTGAITPNTSIAGTYIVTYTIPASAGCSTTTATTSVTINGLPVAVATPATQVICSGNTTSIAISSATAGTTFAWTVVQSGGAAGASNGTGNSIAQTLTTGTAAGTVVYTITPTANGCAGAPIDVTITVNASPTATATPAVSAICSGQSTGITLTSTLPGTTYSWTASQSGATGASDGTGNVISQVLTAGTGIGTVIYTITPTANGCVGMPITATVTVTPPPTATATPDVQSVCSNGTTNIALTSSVPGTVFTWNVVQTNVTGASPGTGNVIAQTLIATSIGEAVYVITPTTNGCPGTPITVRITVYPNPTVTANPASDSICSGSTTNISLSSNLAATTYSWTVITSGLVFGASSGSGDLIAQTLTVLGSSSGSVTYTITPVSNNCTGASIDVTVVVNPSPEVFADTSSVTICSGESPNITLFPSVPGTTFTWTYVATGVTGASNGNTDFIDQDLFATGTTPGTVVYTVIPTANGCTGLSSDFTVTVNPLPTPTLEDGIICVDANGDTFKTYTFETGFSNATYDFVWSYFNGTTTTIINGASSNSYEASEVGTYYVQVTNTITGCVSPLVSGVVTSSTPAANVTVTGSVAFTDNATITVLPAGYLYSLDEGIVQEENVFTNITPGTHSVTITDVNGCTNETKTVFIIGYPHYFTPNGDGINDNWNIIGLDASYNAKIYIFDRYGKLIKQISPNGQGWDGTYNGEPLPSTDYWFNVEYIELGQGKIFNSHFSLKR